MMKAFRAPFIIRLYEVFYAFLFRPVSSINICIFRILFGSFCVYRLLLYVPGFSLFFSADGVPSFAVSRYRNPFPLTALPLPSERAAWFCFTAAVLASILMILGIRVRLAATVLFFSFCSLQARNLLVLRGVDDLLRLVCFFMIFVPSDLALTWRHFRARDWSFPKVEPWSWRLIQFQFCILYAGAFFSKLSDPDWMQGWALYYATHLVEYRFFPVPYVFENASTLKFFNYLTVCIELLIPVLLCIGRYWKIAVFVTLGFHVILGYTMFLSPWNEIMPIFLILFIPSLVLEKALRSDEKYEGLQRADYR